MAKRGRPAKTHDDAQPRSAGTGDNEMNDDQRYSLTEKHRQKYESFLEAKNKANKALIDFGKIIKSDLGAKGLQDIKDLIALSTPEGEEAMKAEMERQARVMRWMNIPIGSQGALFGEEDRAPITDRAFAEGRRQGLAGESQNNPHHHTTEASRAHNDGWQDGQTTLATTGFRSVDGSEVSPSKAWLDQTREQNEAVERAIKSGTIDSLTQN
jgi:ribosome modulation factor